MKLTKTYNAKTLFNGAVIGKEGNYVAVPDIFKDNKIMVKYDGAVMFIEDWHNADGYRRFDDKFGRKGPDGDTAQYTLAYFKWKPKIANADATPVIAPDVRSRLKEEWQKVLAKKESGERPVVTF